MPIVQTIKLDHILATLPELQPFEAELIRSTTNNCLIISAGFEERSNWIMDVVDQQLFSNIVVIKNRQSNEQIIESFSASGNLHVIDFAEASILANLKSHLTKISTCTVAAVNFIVDISAMSSNTIYSVLGSLFDVCEKDDFSIAYCEADDYLPSEHEWDEFISEVAPVTDELEIAERYCEKHFQTVGVSSVKEFPLFPGENIGPRKTKVIAIPNFGLERMKSMLAFVEEHYGADSLDPFWVFGSPPAKKNAWRLGALNKLYNPRNKSDSAPVSTRMYKDALRQFDDLYVRFSDSHLVIASTGSKLQHLATFLFLWMRPDVGLVLSQPQSYNTSSYSKGIASKWHINFGSIIELRDSLAKIDQLKFTWE